VELELIEAHEVTAADHDNNQWGDYDVGDIIYVPSAALAEQAAPVAKKDAPVE
jgi:hypothetical protein